MGRVSEAIFLVGFDGNIQSANAGALQLLGYEQSELVGYAVELLLSADVDHQRALAAMKPGCAPSASASDEIETCFATKAGGSVAVSVFCSSLKDENGADRGRVLVARDMAVGRLAHEKLRLLEKAMSTTRTGITIKGPSGRILYVNPADAQMHGYASPEELMGQEANVFGVREARKPMTPEQVRTMGGLARESSNVREDGSRFPVYLISDVVEDDDGTLLGTVTTCEDITERKVAERRIDHLNRVLRATRNVGQLIIREKKRDALIGSACRLLVENREYTRAWVALGPTPERPAFFAEAGWQESFLPLREMISRGELPPCGEIARSFDRVVTILNPASACITCPMARVCSPREAMAVPLQHQGRLYGVMSISVACDFVADEEEQALFGEVASDIALALHKIDMEEQRVSSQERETQYQQIVSTSADAIICIDPDMLVTLWNPAAASIFGYSASEMLGQSVMKIVPLRYREAKERGFAALQATGHGPILGKTVEFEGLRRDGDEVPLELSFSARKVAGGYAATSVVRDITKRRQAEEELKRALRQEQETTAQLIQTEKLSALGELSASVAHELNQPLNGVKIGCQSILKYLETYSTEALQEELDDILRLVDGMAETVNHIRLFARKSDSMRDRELDLNDLIESALRLVSQQLVEHNIELSRDLEAELPSVAADPIRIEQVFLNLITNAKYAVESRENNSGRRIAIRTYGKRAGNHEQQTQAVVEIQDNGVGIPETSMEKIFQSFFTTKEPGMGTGLGLSIVRRIITEHKGSIEVNSEVGVGTTFRITLPASQQA